LQSIAPLYVVSDGSRKYQKDRVPATEPPRNFNGESSTTRGVLQSLSLRRGRMVGVTGARLNVPSR